MTKRSKLMLGISALLVATGGIAATGTFAWYTATSAASVQDGTLTTGSVGVDDTEHGVNGIKLHAVPVAGAISDLLITNSAGRSYSKNGSYYTEITGTQGSEGSYWADRQGHKAWTVKVTDADGSSAPKADAVASLNGAVYQLKVTPSGQGKASLTETATLGAKGLTPSADTAASGALAATKATAVSGVFFVKFLGTGVVQYSTDGSSYTNWENPHSATQTSNTVFFGIQNSTEDGEATAGLSATYDFTLTPSFAVVG